MRFIKVLFLLLLFFFGLLFFVQNQNALGTMLELKLDLFYQGVSFSFTAVPFYFVLLAAFALGMLFAIFFLFLSQVRLNCSLLSKGRRVRMLEKEVERLRANAAKVIAEKNPDAPANTEEPALTQ